MTNSIMVGYVRKKDYNINGEKWSMILIKDIKMGGPNESPNIDCSHHHASCNSGKFSQWIEHHEKILVHFRKVFWKYCFEDVISENVVNPFVDNKSGFTTAGSNFRNHD